MKCPQCATELRPYKLGQNRPIEAMRCHYCGGFWLTREAWRTIFLVMSQSQAPTPAPKAAKCAWLGISVVLIVLLVILALLAGCGTGQKLLQSGSKGANSPTTNEATQNQAGNIARSVSGSQSAYTFRLVGEAVLVSDGAGHDSGGGGIGGGSVRRPEGSVGSGNNVPVGNGHATDTRGVRPGRTTHSVILEIRNAMLWFLLGYALGAITWPLRRTLYDKTRALFVRKKRPSRR